MPLLLHTLIIWLNISYAQTTSPPDITLWATVESQLTTGACHNCNLSPQAKWYFNKEIIALSPTASSTVVTLPDWLRNTPEINDDALLWVASPEVVETATLNASEQRLDLPDGQQLAFKTIAKIPQNQAYWNTTTSEFFSNRNIRLRGETEDSSFVARTVWPRDF